MILSDIVGISSETLISFDGIKNRLDCRYSWKEKSTRHWTRCFLLWRFALFQANSSPMTGRLLSHSLHINYVGIKQLESSETMKVVILTLWLWSFWQEDARVEVMARPITMGYLSQTGWIYLKSFFSNETKLIFFPSHTCFCKLMIVLSVFLSIWTVNDFIRSAQSWLIQCLRLIHFLSAFHGDKDENLWRHTHENNLIYCAKYFCNIFQPYLTILMIIIRSYGHFLLLLLSFTVSIQ